MVPALVSGRGKACCLNSQESCPPSLSSAWRLPESRFFLQFTSEALSLHLVPSPRCCQTFLNHQCLQPPVFLLPPPTHPHWPWEKIHFICLLLSSIWREHCQRQVFSGAVLVEKGLGGRTETMRENNGNPRRTPRREEKMCV